MPRAKPPVEALPEDPAVAEVVQDPEEEALLARAFDRFSKNGQKREMASRGKRYRPPSLLPVPDPEPGWTFRYIRKSASGQIDGRNMSKRAQEGWVLCRAQDYPNIAALSDKSNDAKDHIEFGGLVLAKLPMEIKEDRDQYYLDQNSAQIQSVDNNYFNLKDRGVETFRDPGSRVVTDKLRR